MKTTGKKIGYFTEAWWFIQDHPLMEKLHTGIMQCLDILVAKVNPATGHVDKDESKNTETEVWLEFGFPERDEILGQMVPTHDIDLDCGAETFEESIVILANLIRSKYP
ncbi:MAG: hypothetical protein UT24_C0029G0004 [Candidatus Woesebacteria bacterium GW2011_GWB1_39_12]|uniref:Uncharacterized protein n=1 Tax=Candidatus Woesebacteria bacterium GW2011_GWB1_39_12 TaxID=1618574 RepID=A0A0G0M6X3_9BACT|nr:MAG: hypothetical protein UT24_C0029G0004 [Candidatus Woesebacteria bacterium GW2011_GWB1_39_12]